MANYEKIPVEQAIRDAREEGTYLINGYDDEQKWRDTQVPGAISFMEFQQKKVGIPKESELIFYCA